MHRHTTTTSTTTSTTTPTTTSTTVPLVGTASGAAVTFTPASHIVFSPQGAGESTATLGAAETSPGAMPQGVVCLTVAGAASMDDNATTLNDVTLGVQGGNGAQASMQGISGNDASFVIGTPSSNVPATYSVSGLQLQTTAQTGPVLVQLATGGCEDTDPADSTVVSTVQIGSVVAEPRTFGADRFSTASDLFVQSATGTSSGSAGPAPLQADDVRAAAATPACHINAVIASGANYPDALAANYLAGRSGLDTQILLVTQNSIPAEVHTALQDSGVARVTIVGGTNAVSAAVASTLSATPAFGCGGTSPAGGNLTVSRIGGATRFDTAEEVVEDLGPDAVGTANLGGVGGTPQRTAIVADGLDFPDAVSAGPMAYGGTNTKVNGNGEGFPLLLTDPTTLSPQVVQAIQDNAITQVLIPGGPAAVSDAVQAQLQALGVATVRFSGIDRTDTAAKIAAFETASATGLVSSGLGYSTAAVDLVRGDGFTDALTVPGFSWSVSQGTPLLLAENPGDLGAPTTAYLELTGAAPAVGFGTGTINVFGGPGALLASTVNAAALALAGG